MEEKEKNEEKDMEQWNDVKGKKSPLPLIIILLLIIAGLGCFIYMKRDVLFESNKEKSNTEEKSQKQDNNETTDDTQEEANEPKQEEIKPLDLAKCLNCKENWIFKDPKEANEGSKTFTLKNENNNITISIDWADFCQYSGLSACPRDVINYDVRGINGNIKNVLIGGSGQSINSITFYYLLDNGTVEYTTLFNNNTDSNGNTYYTVNFTDDNDNRDSDGNPTHYFKSQGPVNGVSNIVKLYNVGVYVQNGSGWATTIGALADGSFYDLRIE